MKWAHRPARLARFVWGGQKNLTPRALIRLYQTPNWRWRHWIQVVQSTSDEWIFLHTGYSTLGSHIATMFQSSRSLLFAIFDVRSKLRCDHDPINAKPLNLKPKLSVSDRGRWTPSWLFRRSSTRNSRCRRLEMTVGDSWWSCLTKMRRSTKVHSRVVRLNFRICCPGRKNSTSCTVLDRNLFLILWWTIHTCFLPLWLRGYSVYYVIVNRIQH